MIAGFACGLVGAGAVTSTLAPLDATKPIGGWGRHCRSRADTRAQFCRDCAERTISCDFRRRASPDLDGESRVRCRSPVRVATPELAASVEVAENLRHCELAGPERELCHFAKWFSSARETN